MRTSSSSSSLSLSSSSLSSWVLSHVQRGGRGRDGGGGVGVGRRMVGVTKRGGAVVMRRRAIDENKDGESAEASSGSASTPVSSFQGNPIMAEGLKTVGIAAPSSSSSSSAAPARKKIYFGVFTQDVDPASVPSAETRDTLRQNARNSLTNIDDAERDRRRVVGQVLLAASAILAAVLYLETDANAITRFLVVFLPFNLGLGYYKSAENGL